MMVSFIDACREDFGVEPICAQLPIALSTYYDAKSRPESARARRHAAMTAVLVALWAANYRCTGRASCGRPPAAPAMRSDATRSPR